MRFFWGLLAVLAAWGGISFARRMGEARRANGRVDAGSRRRAGESRHEGGRSAGRTPDDEIDYDELDRAEREVKDLDATARPEEGFEGDDWGPGTAPRPPIA